MFRKFLTIALAAFALLTLNATGVQAKPRLVGYIQTADKSTYVRFYDNPALARANGDGHCFWGVDNPRDYACTVDGSFGSNIIGFDFARGVGTKKINGAQREYNMRPYFARQLPYCLPRWVELGGRYHDPDLRNTYWCAFWKQ